MFPPTPPYPGASGWRRRNRPDPQPGVPDRAFCRNHPCPGASGWRRRNRPDPRPGVPDRPSAATTHARAPPGGGGAIARTRSQESRTGPSAATTHARAPPGGGPDRSQESRTGPSAATTHAAPPGGGGAIARPAPTRTGLSAATTHARAPPGLEVKAECEGRENFRPRHWYFKLRVGMVELVILAHGAPSIAQGRTPHEVCDELCMAVGSGRV